MYFVPRLSPSATQGLRAEKKGGRRYEQRRMGKANKRDGGGQTKNKINKTRERRARGEAEREVAGKQKNTALANYKLKA